MKQIISAGVVGLAAGLLGFSATSHAALLYNPVLYYSFEGNTNDSSGNNYNGTVNGNPAYAPGVSGQAFSFDGGTNIATTTTDNLGLVNSSFTVDTFVQFVNPGGSNYSIFGTPTGGTNVGLHLLERGDHLYMGFYGNDTAGTTALAAGVWYNVAFVFDSTTGTQSLYLNGALDATSAGHAAFQGTGQTAYVGSSCCDGQLNGLQDNFGVYDTALTQSQVQSLAPEPSMAAVFGIVSAFATVRRRRNR